jgi:predicted enzyme related to lactoylglutathione lyase
MSNRIVHFEIHSTDPEKALAFYSACFGWKANQWGGEDYWLITTGEGEPGIDGGLMRSRDGQPRTVNTLQVDDVDAAVATVLENGGQVALPKMPIPGVGYVAYCIDPTGNLFGVYHSDRTATV